jgi:glycerate 2-kinase
LSSDSLSKFRHDAREIFNSALAAVDARAATRRALNSIRDSAIYPHNQLYVICMGKAALGMAEALNDELARSLVAGICVCPPQPGSTLDGRWHIFHGGHPLPNEASLAAAKEVFRLLDQANAERATIIFAISGGGSAMIEAPVSEDISLADLQQANRVLVGSGASIAEINTIRRAFSAVKGGKLLNRIPNAHAVSLIISDTNEGDVASVASGPTIVSVNPIVSVRELIAQYNLSSKLPASILQAIENAPPATTPVANHPYYVVADNRIALEAAKTKAQQLGYEVEIDGDICEQPIEQGCEEMLAPLAKSKSSTCFISGGEFSCPVRGDGLGGRNSETALRCALLLQDHATPRVVLSAGTDGVDGNSPAAGAMADNTTLERAASLGLNPADYLARSDSYSFFQALGDVILTGPTGTNVRDIRLLLRSN